MKSNTIKYLFCNVRSASSKPVRTLEEREAAYAEARLRILGSAASPEENNHDSNANTNSTDQR